VTTSTSANEPAPGAPQEGPRSLLARSLGVIHSPAATFAAVAAHPRWLGVLVLTLAINATCGVVLMRTDAGRQAFVDEIVRRAEAFGNKISDAQYAQFERMSERGVTFVAVGALVGGLVSVAALAGVLLGVFNVGFDGRASYRQVLAVVAHSGVLLTVRTLFSAPLNYARESFASPTTLGVFFPMLDEGSPAARFLGFIDLFLIWWVIVLAIGMSVLYQRPTRPIALGFLCVYVVIALVWSGGMALLGGTV